MEERLNITIKNNLRLSGIPRVLRETLIEKLKFPNPKWIENHRMGRWNRGVPRELRFYDTLRDGELWIPRGYVRQLISLCRRYRINYRIDDQRRIPGFGFLAPRAGLEPATGWLTATCSTN